MPIPGEQPGVEGIWRFGHSCRSRSIRCGGFIGVKADPGDACTGRAGARDDDEAHIFRDPILPVNIPTLDLQEVCTRLFWFPIPEIGRTQQFANGHTIDQALQSGHGGVLG